MKKIILGTLFLAVAAVAVQAQEIKKEHKRHGKHGELNLTAEQKAKMEALRKKHHEEFLALLTAEQKAKLEQRKKDHKKGERMSKDRMVRMKEELGLTSAQVETLKKQNEGLRESMRSIHENKALSNEQKKEEMTKLKQKRKEIMKSVLTEEQLNKLKSKGKSARKKSVNR